MRLMPIVGRLNAFEGPSLSGLAGQNAPTPLLIFHAHTVIFERVLGRGVGANYPASPDSLIGEIHLQRRQLDRFAIVIERGAMVEAEHQDILLDVSECKPIELRGLTLVEANAIKDRRP
jgi:hypothetical protein